jgi:hypothetical protein
VLFVPEEEPDKRRVEYKRKREGIGSYLCYLKGIAVVVEGRAPFHSLPTSLPFTHLPISFPPMELGKAAIRDALGFAGI